MLSRLSEVSQCGVRQSLARLLVPGLLLGLPFSGLVSCKTGPDVTAPTPCTSYHDTVEVDVTSRGIAFSPNRCLKKDGKARFINKCSNEASLLSIDIRGPVSKVIQPLPHGNGIDDTFPASGTYTITAEGCPDSNQDTKTGTLEVGTGTGGDPVPPGEG